jgi:hypothetical protein
MFAILAIGFMALGIFSCKKDKTDPPFENVATLKKITYLVKGTNFKMNYIDSFSVFQSDRVFQDSFRYEFIKGSGAEIGMSIFLQAPTDVIFSWAIYVNDKLYANAYSQGGAYFTVPYN